MVYNTSVKTLLLVGMIGVLVGVVISLSIVMGNTDFNAVVAKASNSLESMVIAIAKEHG